MFYALLVSVNGSWRITGGPESLWFISAVGLWLLSLLSAPWFQPPRDTLATGVGTFIALITFGAPDNADTHGAVTLIRNIGLIFSVLVIVAAIAAMVTRESAQYLAIGQIAYSLSERMGRGDFLFSFPVFVSAIAGYSDRPITMMGILLIWLAFITIKPSEILISISRRITALYTGAPDAVPVGVIDRVDIQTSFA
jgi:hypothetical protein